MPANLRGMMDQANSIFAELGHELAGGGYGARP